MILNCLCVGFGGFIGAVLRYLVSCIPCSFTAIPLATLAVNVLGSFILAFVATASLNSLSISSELSLFLRVGLCGGFTTFSTFAFELVKLGNDDALSFAIIYLALSVILSIAAIVLAITLAEKLFAA